ncbi:MAG: hypothetical protein AAF846_26545 [Chloroflexota bacterium]
MSVYTATPYQANEGAEVSGANVSVLLNNMRAESLKPLLVQHGFEDLDTDNWYSQQAFLDVIKEIEQQLSYEELVAIGISGADVLELPAEVTDVYQLLPSIVAGYGLHHRNVPEDEGYRIEETGTEVKIVCNIPYPPFVLFGYVYGLVRRLRGEELYKHTVKVDDAMGRPYNIIITK